MPAPPPHPPGVVIPSCRRILLIAALASPCALAAQVSGIGVTATAAYAQIWNRPANGTDSIGAAFSARFNGRVGVAITPTMYAGVAVGSWRYVASNGIYDHTFGELAGAVATAVVASSYIQWYPDAVRHVFVRSGIGYASTITYYPAETDVAPAPLAEVRRTRMSVTAGAGIDVPVRQHFAVTISADYTQLLGHAERIEPVSALLLGAGLTVR